MERSGRQVGEHQTKRIVFSIMRYLQDQLGCGNHSGDSVETLGVALDCIGQVYELDVTNQEHITTYGIDKPLEEIFPVEEAPSSDSQREAEVFKTQGNVHIKNGEIDKAVDCYSKAIELDPNNATYFCNRAAGFIKQQRLQQALEDCQRAVKLNPQYARAHGRMGYVYSSQGKHAQAMLCFQEATRLDPENQSYKENLATVEQQLKAQPQPQGGQQGGGTANTSSSSGPTPGAGIPGLGGMNIGGILSNPAFMNMASSLMSQPGFQQMASRMMGNMAGGGGGGGGEGGGGAGAAEGMMPQVVQMAQEMQRNNPELFQNLQQQAQGLAQQNQQDSSQK